jgi:hypothetical protein
MFGDRYIAAKAGCSRRNNFGRSLSTNCRLSIHWQFRWLSNNCCQSLNCFHQIPLVCSPYIYRRNSGGSKSLRPKVFQYAILAIVYGHAICIWVWTASYKQLCKFLVGILDSLLWASISHGGSNKRLVKVKNYLTLDRGWSQIFKL